MINIIPQTEVRLLKNKLEKDSEHTLSWSNINSQINYMLSCTFKSYTEFTYQRDSQSLVVPDPYDTICTCNYLMYRNNGFTNKYFYAFITKMEYISENSTRIYFEIDSLQTWYFNIEYNKCFVEREHVNDDTMGLHTVPEGLETGEYISLGEPYQINYASDMCLVMGITSAHGSYINNQYTGLEYIFFKDTDNAKAYACLNRYIEDLIDNDEIIQCIFPLPLITVNTIVKWDYPVDPNHYSDKVWYGLLKDHDIETVFDLGAYAPTFNNYLGGNYSPRNKKLLCYPYRNLMLTNNNGANNTLKFEDFSGTPAFQVYGALVPSGSFICMPINYKGIEENLSESILGAKFPIASWTSDLYTNWATQNGINSNFASIVSENDIQLGNFANMFGLFGLDKTGISSNVFGSMKEIYQHKMQPVASRGNINGGDINYSMGNNNFLVYDFVIKEEYARQLDHYFDIYGYKVNEVKTPNITGRRNWNFVRTIGCNFTGDIPEEDLQKIKDIFNRGITFWHNSTNFLNYSANNDII